MAPTLVLVYSLISVVSGTAKTLIKREQAVQVAEISAGAAIQFGAGHTDDDYEDSSKISNSDYQNREDKKYKLTTPWRDPSFVDLGMHSNLTMNENSACEACQGCVHKGVCRWLSANPTATMEKCEQNSGTWCAETADPCTSCQGCFYKGWCRAISAFPAATQAKCEGASGTWCPNPVEPCTFCQGCFLANGGVCRSMSEFPTASEAKCETNSGRWCEAPTPTAEPTPATEAPTQMPTEMPTEAPTAPPVATPTLTPTKAPTAVPTKAPTEATATPGGGCDAIKPTHAYAALPGFDYTAGLPAPMVAHGSGYSMCEIQQLQDDCVAKINEYRAGAPFSDGRTRDHGSKPPLSKSGDPMSKCMNEKALSDLYYFRHNGGPWCGHPSSRMKCGLSVGLGAENSCCPRDCTSYESCKSQLLGCLQQMWDEGMIVLDTGSEEWTMQTGHYWNMIGGGTHVACGFGFDDKTGMLATQNFGSLG